MTIPSTSDTAGTWEIGVTNIARSQARVEGEAAVKLIEQSSAPPVGSEGQGSRINTYG